MIRSTIRVVVEVAFACALKVSICVMRSCAGASVATMGLTLFMSHMVGTSPITRPTRAAIPSPSPLPRLRRRDHWPPQRQQSQAHRTGAAAAPSAPQAPDGRLRGEDRHRYIEWRLRFEARLLHDAIAVHRT